MPGDVIPRSAAAAPPPNEAITVERRAMTERIWTAQPRIALNTLGAATSTIHTSSRADYADAAWSASCRHSC